MNTKRSYRDPSAFLNETPLPITHFRPSILLGKSPPHVLLRKFQSQHCLQISASDSCNCIIQRIFQRYSSPLLFALLSALDSALNHQNNTTVVASMLMHFDTKLHPLTIPPKPILLCNHVPHSQTISNQLQKHVHTTSIHHYSELCWPDPTTHPKRATYPELVHFSIQQQLEDIVQLIPEQVDITSILDLNQDKLIQPLEPDKSSPPKEHVGLCIGHHFFLHINSHQLTNFGGLQTKETEEGEVQI